MPSIRTRKTKDGEVRYEVQVRLRGAPAEVATFERLRDAKQWAQEREVAIREQRRFGRTLTERRTLADAIDRFTKEHLARLSPSSRPGRERALRFWRDRLGHLGLVELTPNHFSRALSEFEGDAGVAAGTVNRYASAIARVMSIAEREWGWIQRNPVRMVTRRREPPGRVRYLSETERTALLEACRESRTADLYPLVLLALSTGGRYSEVAGLRWEDVNLELRTVTFHRTKNRERRSVPFASVAADALRELGGERTGPIFRAKSYRTAWEWAIARAGIEDFRFHDLRHTCASYLAMSGASLLEIAELLGHKTLAMVKRYSHLSTGHLRQVSSRMEEKFLTPTSPGDPKASD